MYISFGMTPDQYWNGNPKWAKEYREAHLLMQQRTNRDAWRDGQYTLSAFQTVIANALAKKGTNPIQYIKEPLPLTQKDVEDRKLRDEIERHQRIVEKMNKWAKEGG